MRLGYEALRVARQHQARARHFRGGHLAIEPDVARERLELQGLTLAIERSRTLTTLMIGLPERRRSARWASVAVGCLSQENPSANARAPRPSRATSPGSAARSSMRCAHAGISPCGTRKPVSPSRTDSLRAELSEASAGVPQAAASTFEIPHPSLVLASTTAQARRIRRRFSSSDTNPRKRTASATPSVRGEQLEPRPIVSLPRDLEREIGSVPPGRRQGPQDRLHSFVPLQAPDEQERRAPRPGHWRDRDDTTRHQRRDRSP